MIKAFIIIYPGYIISLYCSSEAYKDQIFKRWSIFYYKMSLNFIVNSQIHKIAINEPSSLKISRAETNQGLLK